MIALPLLLMLQLPDTVRIGERICARCELRVDSVGTIASGEDISGFQLVVARDARGRWLIADGAGPPQIRVYDSTGRFERIVGRSGVGPNEYRRISGIVALSSGVVVADDFARRYTVLGADFRHVRTARSLGEPQGMLPGPGGTDAEAAILKAGPDAGYTLFFRDVRGRARSRQSPVPTPYREVAREFYRRTVSAAPGEQQFWLAQRHAYVFERCEFASTACTRYARRATWFPVPLLSELPAELSDEAPPLSRLQGVVQSDDRYLWAVSLVADRAWRAGLAKGRVHAVVADPNRYWDSVIERIDLESHSVVASHRIDEALLWAPLAGGYAAFYREDAEGLPTLIFVRLSVRALP